MKFTLVLLIFGIILLISIPINSGVSSLALTPIDELKDWAEKRQISLQGVNKDSKHFVRTGSIEPSDKIPLQDVPDVINQIQSLYLIPDNVMDVMQGKTIYLSSEYGRSYAVYSIFTKQTQDNELLNRGLIIEQGTLKRTVVHELGHIVDFHGIQGRYDDQKNIFSSVLEQRDDLFEIDFQYDPKTGAYPAGFVSSYSMNNENENFAEHFAYYVMYPDEFREKMASDPLLKSKYEFLRDHIFEGTEY